MNKASLYLLAIVAVLAVQAKATEVQNCVTGSIDRTSVSIENCTIPPCKINRGDTVGLIIRFKPTSTIESLVTNVTVKLQDGRTISLAHLDSQDACNDIRKASNDRAASCPPKQNFDYVYQTGAYFNSSFPAATYKFHWGLQQNDANVACFEVDCELL